MLPYSLHASSLRYVSLPSSDQPLPSFASTETFRPSNLPPKNKLELQLHNAQVNQLDARFRQRIQEECVQRALKRLHREQETYRFLVLNDLWLRRLLPDLSNRYAKGLPIGHEIDSAWRQGLPPRIRKVVWPLAIGNSLRITPELFEICSQKAAEVRTLEHLTGTRQKGAQRTSRCLLAAGSHNNGPLSSVPTTAASSSESLLAFEAQNTSSPATKALDDESELVRLSLIELLKNRELVSNRENSLDCILPDVPRTFPSLPAFQSSGPLYAACQKLLESWVCYRPDVGYVQGMSFLAALLLVHLDVFPAFVCLCNLLSSPSLLGMYRMNPKLITKRYAIFEQLLHQENPRLSQHLRQLAFPKEMYLLEWFLTLFSKPLSLPIASYVWDLYLLDGEVTLYVAAVAIMQLIAHHVLPNPCDPMLKPKDLLAQQGDQCDDHTEEEEELHHYLFERARRTLLLYLSLEGREMGLRLFYYATRTLQEALTHIVVIVGFFPVVAVLRFAQSILTLKRAVDRFILDVLADFVVTFSVFLKPATLCLRRTYRIVEISAQSSNSLLWLSIHLLRGLLPRTSEIPDTPSSSRSFTEISKFDLPSFDSIKTYVPAPGRFHYLWDRTLRTRLYKRLDRALYNREVTWSHKLKRARETLRQRTSRIGQTLTNSVITSCEENWNLVKEKPGCLAPALSKNDPSGPVGVYDVLTRPKYVATARAYPYATLRLTCYKAIWMPASVHLQPQYSSFDGFNKQCNAASTPWTTDPGSPRSYTDETTPTNVSGLLGRLVSHETDVPAPAFGCILYPYIKIDTRSSTTFQTSPARPSATKQPSMIQFEWNMSFRAECRHPFDILTLTVCDFDFITGASRVLATRSLPIWRLPRTPRQVHDISGNIWLQMQLHLCVKSTRTEFAALLLPPSRSSTPKHYPISGDQPCLLGLPTYSGRLLHYAAQLQSKQDEMVQIWMRSAVLSTLRDRCMDIDVIGTVLISLLLLLKRGWTSLLIPTLTLIQSIMLWKHPVVSIAALASFWYLWIRVCDTIPVILVLLGFGFLVEAACLLELWEAFPPRAAVAVKLLLLWTAEPPSHVVAGRVAYVGERRTKLFIPTTAVGFGHDALRKKSFDVHRQVISRLLPEQLRALLALTAMFLRYMDLVVDQMTRWLSRQQLVTSVLAGTFCFVVGTSLLTASYQEPAISMPELGLLLVVRAARIIYLAIASLVLLVGTFVLVFWSQPLRAAGRCIYAIEALWRIRTAPTMDVLL